MEITGYDIQKEIGQGGMATVHLAVQKSLKRQVALKVLPPVMAAESHFRYRFMNEACLVAQLSHPGIIAIHDVGLENDHLYMAMEYLPGGDLKSKILQGLTTEESIDTILKIAAALSHAHMNGIVHRDIKPENILFRRNNMPVLSDFGVAKGIGSDSRFTRDGMSIGTPQYMSPEQVRGDTVDHRSDLYSLGILFYEMLTGYVPYNADDFYAIGLKHINNALPRLMPQYDYFQPILNRLLAKDPDERYQSAEAVIKAIKEARLPSLRPPNSFGTAVRPIIMSAAADSASKQQRFSKRTAFRAIGFALAATLVIFLGFLIRKPEVQSALPVGTAVAKPPLKEIGYDKYKTAFNNGTVFDAQTGLMWAAADNGKDVRWESARRYCQSYNGGGYKDWRMPTMEELKTLNDLEKEGQPLQCCPGYPAAHFTSLIRLSSCSVWAVDKDGNKAGDFDFCFGYGEWGDKNAYDAIRVLPVRDIK